jgi:hypothetical protein
LYVALAEINVVLVDVLAVDVAVVAGGAYGRLITLPVGLVIICVFCPSLLDVGNVALFSALPPIPNGASANVLPTALKVNPSILVRSIFGATIVPVWDGDAPVDVGCKAVQEVFVPLTERLGGLTEVSIKHKAQAAKLFGDPASVEQPVQVDVVVVAQLPMSAE